MNKLEKYLVELLQHNIIYNNEEVILLKHFPQKPLLPLITLDLTNAPSTFKVYREDNGQETVIYHRTATININCWCNTEEERESITSQILRCFYQEQSNYFKFCVNYDNGHCNSINNPCEVSTYHNSEADKGKCPNPIRNSYCGLSDKYNLIWGSVNIEEPFELDEITEHPPLLRSILRCEGEYLEEYLVGGIELQTVRNNNITLI